MLRRETKEYTLYGVPVIAPDGAESVRAIGTVRALVTSRSSEETMEDDVYRATETVSAILRDRCAPDGGFRRGMTLRRGEEEYRMLTPVRAGRMWIVKCARTHL